MITHNQLLEMWEEDVNIDKHRLDDESLNIPKLHHKYLALLMDIKSKRIAFNHQLEDIKREKELYYSGQATAAVYKEKPFDTKLKTKAGIEKHVNTDHEVVKLEEKIEYMNILIEGVNHILENVKWRNQNIKSAIDWSRFQSGEL